MASSQPLSDKALAIFAFAAFHQLESGQRVSSVVRRDDAGHRADEEAVRELAERGLVRADERFVHFTEEGERLLQETIGSLRRSFG
jgi:predicted methyltransferase